MFAGDELLSCIALHAGIVLVRLQRALGRKEDLLCCELIMDIVVGQVRVALEDETQREDEARHDESADRKDQVERASCHVKHSGRLVIA